jgi:CRISPR-associated protein Cpf1
MGVTSSNQGIRYVYEFQNVDNKNIPRLFIRSKGTRYAPSVEKYNLPIEEIIDIYDSEKFKTEYRKINETEYKQSLIKIIDYFKLGFARHESFKNYDIQWKASDEYDNINEFYKDVSNCCYRLGEETINFDVLRECEKSGKIYLFKIYNKDFSPDSTGRPNLHTLYWKSIFSRENLEDTVIRLDGNAEIFYRKASISEPVKHRKGEKVVNKWDVDNKPIPDTIYREIYDYSNNRISEISETAKAYIENNKVIIKDVKHDIVKDKRYTKNQYLLHTTISINFKQQEKIYRFNSAVCEVLKNNADVNIIGIDRGERNLIYITVINQKGEILEQKSFNNIQSAKGKVNYHAKLTQKENQRANARKNWETIENIKELKEGYLSLVIHEIAQMMISYNAIVVMEDLNKGFKGERSKVEKQVYQKFEKMLIDKLNYLTFKADKSGELKKYTDIGGVLNGYQLTDKVQSFKSIRRQCGFLFYVPANYTSKIDPMSGFVDVFRKNKKPTLDYIRKFLKLFDFIHWDSSHGFFVFEFDYDNFETVQTSYVKKWKLTSAGTRYVWNRTNGNCTYNPTEEIIRVLEENNIIYKDERNLVTDIDKMGNDIIKGIYYSFRYILQLRNERKLESYDEEELRNSDYIFSPAIVDGIQFDSRKDYGSTKYPVDSDANGAYHIALKGLICLKKISEKASADGYIVEKNFDITVAEWLKFIQNKEYIDK